MRQAVLDVWDCQQCCQRLWGGEGGQPCIHWAQTGNETYKKRSEFTVGRAGFQRNSWRKNLGGGLFILSICSCGCLANEMTGFPLVGCEITCFGSLVHCFGPDEETSVSLIRCLGRRFSYCFFDWWILIIRYLATWIQARVALHWVSRKSGWCGNMPRNPDARFEMFLDS